MSETPAADGSSEYFSVTEEGGLARIVLCQTCETLKGQSYPAFADALDGAVAAVKSDLQVVIDCVAINNAPQQLLIRLQRTQQLLLKNGIQCTLENQPTAPKTVWQNFCDDPRMRPAKLMDQSGTPLVAMDQPQNC